VFDGVDGFGGGVDGFGGGVDGVDGVVLPPVLLIPDGFGDTCTWATAFWTCALVVDAICLTA
jgi:hypothetical protein